jgi:hypothetical protein
MATAVHLISRFFGSLRPGGPSLADRRWVERQLLATEFAIWSGLPGPDRRHSAAVAHRVSDILSDRADRAVLAAALLHDSGKTVSGLHTPGRVVATLVGSVLGRDRARAELWCERSGPRRRIGQYWLHPELGAELLEAAGSDALTVTWTREHHLPPTACTLDPVVADALRSADDD